jgi:outer membrane protein assembly factor BamB
MTKRSVFALAAVPLGTALCLSLASAQTLDAKRPRTFTVGAPRGAAVAERVDAARSGRSSKPLPSSNLHVEWRRALGSSIDHAPLVDASETVYALASRGDVVAFAPDGTEKWRVATGVPQPGPGALLSDGTVVFVGASGEAIGARAGVQRFRTRVGRAEPTGPNAAPLPLDDGGAIVATSLDLAVLDAEGNARARGQAPEPITAPLVSALGKVVVVGASGAVYAWAPGAGDPTRVGSFGARIDGAAALVDAHTLVAVVGSEVKAVDLTHNVTSTRGAPPLGAYVGPVAARGDSVYLLEFTQTGSFVVGLDASGNETLRAQATTYAPLLSPDGGAVPIVVPPHSGPIVDSSGTLAFAAPDGPVGIATGSGTTASIELVSELVCSRSAAPGSRPAATVAGLAPASSGTLVVACSSGAVVKVSAGKSF